VLGELATTQKKLDTVFGPPKKVSIISVEFFDRNEFFWWQTADFL
jgi:hypothetical protein